MFFSFPPFHATKTCVIRRATAVWNSIDIEFGTAVARRLKPFSSAT